MDIFNSESIKLKELNESERNAAKTGVYKIMNSVTGATYIGSSIDIEGRFTNHKKHLRRGTHSNQHLQRSWTKYGEAAFLFEIIAQCLRGDLLAIEQHHIDLCLERKISVFNMKPSWESRFRFAYKPTEETIRKIVTANTGKKHPPRSAETILKLKLAASRRGKRSPLSEEAKAKIGAAHRGRKHSDEAKRNMSNAHMGPRPFRKGFRHSEETKNKISLAKIGSVGYIRTEKHRELARRKFAGKPLSVDHVRKLREAWERRRMQNVAR